MTPGATTFTRIGTGASSTASDFAAEIIAPDAAAARNQPSPPRKAAVPLVIAIEPPGRMCGTARRIASNAATTRSAKKARPLSGV